VAVDMQIDDLTQFIQHSIVGSDSPKIDKNSRLFEDGLIDSLSILHLVGYIEKSLGRKLQDSELLFEYFSTPEMIVKRYGKA